MCGCVYAYKFIHKSEIQCTYIHTKCIYLDIRATTYICYCFDLNFSIYCGKKQP